MDAYYRVFKKLLLPFFYINTTKPIYKQKTRVVIFQTEWKCVITGLEHRKYGFICQWCSNWAMWSTSHQTQFTHTSGVPAVSFVQIFKITDRWDFKMYCLSELYWVGCRPNICLRTLMAIRTKVSGLESQPGHVFNHQKKKFLLVCKTIL